MTKPAAFTGTFSDIRSVKTRGVVQLIIELPIEKAAEVIAAWGYPQPASEIPVAVARLSTAAASAPPSVAGTSGGGEFRKWDEMPMSQQAGIRCNEPSFRAFLNHKYGTPQSDIQPDQAVRGLCQVQSRSEIIRGTPAGDRWHDLDVQFQNWKRGEQ